MKKSVKIILIVFVTLVALAGLTVGGYFLFKKKPDNTPPRYTETERNLIDSINGSTGKIESSEENIVLPAEVSVKSVEGIYDDYIVVNDDATGDKKIVSRKTNTFINFYISFNTVVAVYKDYALVKNVGSPSDADATPASLLNLKTGTVLRSGLSYDAYYRDLTLSLYGGYYFAGNYLILSTIRDGVSPDMYSDEFFIKVVNLENGNIVLDLSAGNDLENGDKIFNYEVSERFLIVESLKHSVVYDLNSSNSPRMIKNFDNSMVPTISSSYDYQLGGLNYWATERYELVALSTNKIFVTHYVQENLENDASFKFEKEYGANDYGFYKQECFVYDVANNETSQNLVQAGEYLKVQKIDLDGFALILSYKINEDKTVDLDFGDAVANYYQLAGFKKVLSYDYNEYGQIIAFKDDKFICGGNGGAVLNLKGELEFKPQYRIANVKSFDGYFVVRSGNSYGLFDINGNQLIDVNYKWISPVIGGHCLVFASNNIDVYNFDVSTRTRTKIDNFYAGFNSYAYNGVDFYVTLKGGEYALYSIQGTLLKDHIAESNFKLVKVEGGVSAVYKENGNSQVKSLTTRLIKKSEETVVASVRYLGLPKYNVKNIAYADNSSNALVKVADNNKYGCQELTFNNFTAYKYTYTYVHENGSKFPGLNLGQYLLDYGDIFNRPDSSNNYIIEPLFEDDNVLAELKISATNIGTNRFNVNATVHLKIKVDGYVFGLGHLTRANLAVLRPRYQAETKLDAQYATSYNQHELNFSFQINDVRAETLQAGTAVLNQGTILNISTLQVTITPVNIVEVEFSLKKGVGKDDCGMGSNIIPSETFNANLISGEDGNPDNPLTIKAVEGMVSYEVEASGNKYSVTFIEAFSKMQFLDYVEKDNGEIDVVNVVEKAIENGNSGRDGTVIVCDKDGNPLTKQGDKLIDSQGRNYFTSDCGYYIYSGGSETIRGSISFAGLDEAKYYGLVDNVKAEGFPFTFKKAGYSADALSLYNPNENAEDVVGPKQDFNKVGPVYIYDENSKGLVITTAGDYAKDLLYYEKNKDEIIKLVSQNDADNPDADSTVLPIYQLFNNWGDKNTQNGFNPVVRKVKGEDKNEYDFTFNDNVSGASSLKINWKPVKYDVYFYAEQEQMNGQDLVGSPTTDWYFPNLAEKGAFTFSSEKFAGASSSKQSAVINNGVIRNKINNAFSVPVVAMKNKNDDNKVEFGSSLLGLPIPVKFGYEFVGWQAMKVENNTLWEILDDKGQRIILKEGDKLSFSNCDYGNQRNEIFFKAIFEEKTYQLAVEVDYSGFTPEDGASWSTNGWENEIDVANRTITFTKEVKFAELKALGKGEQTILMPTRQNSRWQISNYFIPFEIVDDLTGDSDSFRAFYADANLVSGTLENNNADLMVARNFDLITMLQSVDKAVKVDHKEQSINKVNDKYIINNGYNITELNMKACLILADAFVELNGKGVSGQYYLNGVKNEHTLVAIPNEADGNKALGQSFSQISFDDLKVDASENKRIKSLDIRLYTGVGTEYVTVRYNFVWKNGKYFDVTLDNVDFTKAPNSNVNNAGDVAQLIGLGTANDLNNIISISDDKLSISINIQKLTKFAMSIADSNIIKKYNHDDTNGELRQVYYRSVELNFDLEGVSFDVIMGALEEDDNNQNLQNGNEASKGYIEKIVNNDNTLPFIKNGNGIGAIATGAGQGRISTADKGYELSSMGKVIVSKSFEILCGGQVVLEKPVYSHFMSQIILADLTTEDYDKANKTFTYGIAGYSIFKIEMFVEYEGGSQVVSVKVNGGREIELNSDDTSFELIENKANLKISISRNVNESEFFTLNASVEIGKGDGTSELEIPNDMLVASMFSEFKQGEADITAKKDGVETSDGVDEIKYPKDSTNTDKTIFNATEQVEAKFAAPAGFYLKSLKIDGTLVLQGYPYFDTETNTIAFSYVASQLNGSTSPFYFRNTLMHVRCQAMNGYNGKYFVSSVSPEIEVILDGLYRKASVEVEFESVTMIYVANSIVKFEDASTLSSLDYIVTLNKNDKTSLILNKLEFTEVPEMLKVAPSGDSISAKISNYAFTTGNYYLTDNSETQFNTLFIILGQDVETIDFKIDDNYANYLTIQSANNENVNVVEKKGIKPKNNLVLVALAKNMVNDISISFELGYSAGNVWNPYLGNSHYKEDEWRIYKELLANRFHRDTYLSYYGINSNPVTKNNVTTDNLVKNVGGLWVTENYQFIISAFKNTDIEIGWSWWNISDENAVSFGNYYGTPVVVDGNGNTIGTVDALNNTITIPVNAITNKQISIRFEANKYNLWYRPNKPDEMDNNVTYGANTVLGETDNKYIISVPFDSYNVSLTNNTEIFLKAKYKGYNLVGWNTSTDDKNGTYLARLEDPAAPNGRVTISPADEKIITSPDLQKTGENTDNIATVYAIWKVKTITVTFNLNDGGGSTAASFNGLSAGKTYSQSYNYGELYSNEGKMPNPTRKGYTLLGWTKDITKKDYLTYDSNTLITADKNNTVDEENDYAIYAIWKPNIVKVTYHKAQPDVNINGFVGGGFPTFGTATVTDEDKYIKDVLASLKNKNTDEEVLAYTFNYENGKIVSVTVNVLFDTVIPYFSITLLGHDFKGWLIKNNEEWPIAPVGGTSLISDYVTSVDGKLSMDAYAKWELQGVKVLLITQPNGIESDYNRLKGIALSDISWLTKDANGKEQGVTNNFDTYYYENDTSKPYNISIPYYSKKDYVISGLNAPTATGYIFSGYYYYTGDDSSYDNSYYTQYISADSEGGVCRLTQQWKLTWDLKNPIKLYAQWKVKTYEVSISVGDSYKYLFEGKGLTYPGYTGDNAGGEEKPYSLNCKLSIRLKKRGRVIQDGQEVFIEESEIEKQLTSSGTITITYNFYDQVNLNITMAGGHYLSDVVVNGNTRSAKWDNENYCTTGLNSFKSSPSSTAKLDNFTLSYGPYYGANSGANSDLKFKQDISGLVNNIVTAYDIELQFARQWFEVVVKQALFNKNNVASEGGTAFEQKVPHFGVVRIDAISSLPFYEADTNILYTDVECQNPFTGNTAVVYDNMKLYIKYTPSDNVSHAGTFYEFTDSGYTPINTGYNYVYATINDGRQFINGEQYTWTNYLGPGGVILALPVPTEYYWPNEVDGQTTGLRFIGWLQVSPNNTIAYDLSNPLTYYQILAANGGKEVLLVKEGVTTLNAGDCFYPVFESVDKTVQLSCDLTESILEGSDADYYIDFNGNRYKSLKLKLGVSKIDVQSVEVFINDRSYGLAIMGSDNAKTSFETNKVWYDYICPQTAGQKKIEFKITSRSGITYTSSAIYLNVVDNKADYKGSTVTYGGETNKPTTYGDYFIVDNKYYTSATFALNFSRGNRPSDPYLVTVNVPTNRASNRYEATRITLGSKTWVVYVTITYNGMIDYEEEIQSGFILSYSVSISVQLV